MIVNGRDLLGMHATFTKRKRSLTVQNEEGVATIPAKQTSGSPANEAEKSAPAKNLQKIKPARRTIQNARLKAIANVVRRRLFYILVEHVCSNCFKNAAGHHAMHVVGCSQDFIHLLQLFDHA
jgi:hypothetical protein